MERRKFLLTSGTALLGSTSVQSVTQKPSLALNFDLVGVENVRPSNTDTILVDFENFELVPKYVDETEEDATITITLDIKGKDSKQTQTTVSLVNGERISASSLGSAIPIIQDGIRSSQKSLEGTVKVEISHTSISDSYQQSFRISNDPLLDGLVGYWPLHEWYGRANDLGNQNDHGRIVGSLDQGVSGKSGLTSYKFDGSSIVEISKNKVDSLSEFTVSVWCSVENFNGSESSHGLDTNVVSNADNGTWGSSGNDSFQIGYNSDKQITVYLDDNGNHEHISGDTQVEVNEWHHLAVAHNGSKAVLYLDGNKETEWNHPLPMNNNAYFKIGAGFDKEQALNGKAQNVRVYDRYLTEGDIGKMYNISSGNRTSQTLHDGSDPAALSRWKFENGNESKDSWGKNSITDQSSAGTTENSVRGTSNVLDGNDDYLELGITDVKRGDKFTINLWTYKLGSTDSSTDEVIWLSDNLDNSNGRLYIEASNSLYQFYVNSEIIKSNYSFRNGWTMHTITCDGSKTDYYLNSVWQGRVNDTISIPDILIGQDNNTRFFDGYIDDTRLYTRSFDQDEIFELYQWGTRGQDLRERTTTKNKNDMLAWWKLNERNGSTAYDSSANNDGTSNGAGPSGTGTSDGPTGGSAYRFDSDSDDYIDIPDNSKLDLNGGDMSLSLWFRTSKIITDSILVESGVFQSGYGLRLEEGTVTSGKQNIQWRLDDGSNPISIRKLFEHSDGNYHHMVGTYSTNNGAKVYLDGREIGRDSTTIGEYDGSQINIGRLDSSNQTGKYYSGDMSDIRLYRRELTPQEVSYLYEQKF